MPALSSVDPIESLAALCGVANIVLIARRSVWNFAFGMVMVCLYAGIFWQARLYAAAGLQGFFLASQVYGLWYWRQSGPGPVPVRRLGRAARLAALAAGSLGTLLLGLVLARTDAAAPWPDAANAAWSMVAQVLTDRRHTDSWPLWIGINLLSVWLYAGQGLLATAALYILFLGLAAWGWRQWSRAEQPA